MILRPKDIREAALRLKSAGFSMRRRFAVYLLALVLGFAALLFILLSLFGVLDLTTGRLERSMEHELENSAFRIEQDMEHLAACALSLSEQLADETGRFLARQDLQFADLKNDIERLGALQLENYGILRTYIQMADCSGAFYILNTTVNDRLPTPYYNGLYLKLANVYSQSRVNQQVSMLYGASATAVETNADLHTAWQFEVQKGVYPEMEAMLTAAVETDRDFHDYLLTTVYEVPGTWENIRLLCVPVLDWWDQCIGVCGFELSSQYFQLAYLAGEAGQKNLVFGLLSETEDGYAGQIAGNRSGYSPSAIETLTRKPGAPFDTFYTENETFIGKCQEITVGSSTVTAAVMLSEPIYHTMLREDQRKTILLLGIVLLLVTCACILLSKKYVEPLLKGIESLKTGGPELSFQSSLPEINDLFAFLSEKDRERDRELKRLLQMQLDAQAEYEKIQTRLTRLMNQRKKEIDPDSYAMFAANLKMLTPKEREVFELYMQGKSAREIVALMEFSDNALKFHNKNIYSKLGVASRKELLMYAAFMEQERQRKTGI